MLPIVGIGAGLVSALLFAVVITGSPLALLLSNVAPLPVFIAALGWNHRAGLVACATGAVAVGLVMTPALGVAFAIGAALPAWWIAWLVLLGRENQAGQMEWYPLGRLLLWIAGIAGLVTVIGALAISTDHETYVRAMRRGLGAILEGAERGGAGLQLPRGITVADIAGWLSTLVPIVAGASFVPMLAANLWLAGKAVRISARLPRPWPHIPSTVMPRVAVPLLAGALLVASFPGFVGLAGSAAAGALVSAFALAGLAFVHDVSRGRGWRMPVLVGLYLALVIMLITIFPFLALIGIADALLDLRAHTGTKPPPPPGPV